MSIQYPKWRKMTHAMSLSVFIILLNEDVDDLDSISLP